MKQLTIFGKQYTMKEQKSNKDDVELRGNEILVRKNKKTTTVLLRDFLSELLYRKLLEIAKSINTEGKIGIFGNLDFEITENIDSKKQRIAKLKGNKILVKLNAVALPENALKYMVTHEFAHITTKQHTRKFWKTVKLIYPDYEAARNLLTEHSEINWKIV
jgi:predicted metal-dependent hydrolase